MIGLRVGLRAALYAKLAVGCGADELGGDVADAFTAVPGQANIVDENGARGYRANIPVWFGRQQYYERENGAAGELGQGQNAWNSSFTTFGGEARTPLTGRPSWFNNSASIETGTNAAGSYALTLGSAPAIAFDATSGTWTYEITFRIPVLSDATDRFVVSAGFNDNSNGLLTVDGAYLRYVDNLNSGKFEFVTASNSTRTTVDTGVTLVAGDYYHLRIRVTNNTLAEMWLKTTQSGVGAWTDDGIWGAPTATSSTNIPSGTARVLQCGPSIIKTAGTTSRLFELGYQIVERRGAAGEQPGMVRGIDENGAEEWTWPQRMGPPIVFVAYHRGAFNPTAGADLGPSTLLAGAIDGVAADNGGIGTTRVRTGANNNGAAAIMTARNIVVDADMNGYLVVESEFSIPVLSSGAQPANLVIGLANDDAAAVHTRGITLEINSNADAQAQCVVAGPSGTTTVDSGITIVAGTYYALRIVITSSQVLFYLRASGAAAYGAPVATITTNIPTGVDLAMGVINRKLGVGITNNDCYVKHILGYQRSTTNANANYGKIRVAEDDNSGVVGSTYALVDNVPSPRTQPYAILSTAHTLYWGSSDVGTGAGGDASLFDATHPNPFTTYTGTTTTGHVALGPAGDVSAIVFSATSGQRIFDYVGQIEDASDGTDTFFVRLGFVSHIFNAVTNGIYINVDANASANVQLITVANSVATTTDTGVPWNPDTWYRLRIEVDNNTAVRCWIVADDAAWPSTPTVSVTTNIPSGTSQATKVCVTVKKSAGTSTRKLATFYATVAADRYGAQ